MNVLKQTHAAHVARPTSRAGVLTLAAAVVIATVGTVAWAEDSAPVPQTPFPVAVVGALNALSGGPHAGYRANHAKGVLVSGEFTLSLTAVPAGQVASQKALLFNPLLVPADPLLLARLGAYAISYGRPAP